MNNLTFIYDPSCTSVQDIKSKVRQHEMGLGFVFGGHIYYKQDSQVSNYKVSTDAMSRCFNRNDNDQIETNIHGLLSEFRAQLGAIANYELQVLSANQTITIPYFDVDDDMSDTFSSRSYNDKGINSTCMFSVSNRSNNTDCFDLCLYDDSNKTLCYNQKTLGDFTHSGDIHSNRGSFLHTIHINKHQNRIPFYLS